jgi:hypothetical protein
MSVEFRGVVGAIGPTRSGHICRCRPTHDNRMHPLTWDGFAQVVIDVKIIISDACDAAREHAPTDHKRIKPWMWRWVTFNIYMLVMQCE